jgi:diguanylate cyclase (GGDEF)-like protein|tara:strand:- start:1627 stop:2568 length:942 start_codon:yes stop_codon:yes gene_type:complete
MFDLPIVVVKGGNSILDFFDHELIKFTNNRVCYGAVNALQILDDSPANVVITEVDVGDMTGIELAEAIRDIDLERDHYTYVILIGAVNHRHVETEVFHQSIDMVTGTKRVDILTHLTFAGGRISKQLTDLMVSQSALQRLCTELRKGQLLDPLTGLGNRSFAEHTLHDSVRQIESRGGAVCFLMISIQNYEAVKESYDTTIAGELVLAVSERIQALVRPLDVVTYYAPGQFALILMQPSIEQCTQECYQRIYEGVKLKTYSTSAGYQPVEIAMSICAGSAETGPPNENVMISTAIKNLDTSQSKDCIVVKHIS